MVKGKAGKQFTTLQRDRLDYIRYVCSSPGFSIFSISESTQQYLFFFHPQTKLCAAVPAWDWPTACLVSHSRLSYMFTPNKMKSVHWPFDGCVVTFHRARTHCAQTPRCCTKCNRLPINGQCTNQHRPLVDVPNVTDYPSMASVPIGTDPSLL